MAKPWILVVYDDLPFAAMVCTVLEKNGYAVTTATDARQAFIQAETLNPSLVIMDLQLPAFGTGADAVRAMRAHPRMSRTAVLIMTAVDLRQAASMFPADQNLRLMAKPPDWNGFLRTVRELVPAPLAWPSPPARPQAAAPPAAAQPRPQAVPPKPQTVPPKPQTVPPKPQTVPPKPQAVPPKPQAVPPRPQAPPSPQGRPVPAPQPAAAAAPGARRRVLIVDDDPGVTDLGVMVLRSLGYDVRIAASGTAGITAARAFRPDVMFCDLIMPGMTGMEVVRAMQVDPDLSGIPVVVMTAMEMSPQARALFMAQPNFRQWLKKPFDPSSLIAVLDMALSGAAPGPARPASDKPAAHSVLVVEDDLRFFQLLGLLFEPHDSVVRAEDGVEALAALRKDRFQLVLSDMMMPRMSGMELLRAMQADRKLASIPVIIITGVTLTPKHREMMLRDFRNLKGIFAKPLEVDEVRGAIQALLAGGAAP